MRPGINETVNNSMTEKSVSAYRLYNLVFSGKITMQEYLRTVRTLKNNERSSRGFEETKQGI